MPNHDPQAGSRWAQTSDQFVSKGYLTFLPHLDMFHHGAVAEFAEEIKKGLNENNKTFL